MRSILFSADICFQKTGSMDKKRTHSHQWRETPPLTGSFRSIFKWGDPNFFKHPNTRLFNVIRERLGAPDSAVLKGLSQGDEPVQFTRKTGLSNRQIVALQAIVGVENLSTGTYDRLKYSTGQTTEESLELRSRIIGDISDAVVHPRNKKEIGELIRFCNTEKIPVYACGGGTSVNFGIRPVKGGITLVMTTHMNRIVSLNEENQTITVEGGIMGPALEHALNRAPEILKASRRYTCGHFPQSFEHSTAGGWVMASGSGQLSTYYGDASGLIAGMEFISPGGSFITHSFPAAATGPDIRSMISGSEGAFGIAVEVTLKIFRHMPENRKSFAFLFPRWENAITAAREITQSEAGLPGLLRISDPEETDIAFRMYGLDSSILETAFRTLSLRPMKRCLMIGQAYGERSFSKNIHRMVKRISRMNKGRYLTGYPVKKWEHGRFTDPYLRDDLLDCGIIIDTLETSVTWDRLYDIHSGVREFIKKEGAICMTHCSHFYPQGTNLYFIIIMKYTTIGAYRDFIAGIIDRIAALGGSLSHHHGIGKMLAPWMERYMGETQMGILRAIKRYLDPQNIMNPGGQLGLDRAKKRK